MYPNRMNYNDTENAILNEWVFILHGTIFKYDNKRDIVLMLSDKGEWKKSQTLLSVVMNYTDDIEWY